MKTLPPLVVAATLMLVSAGCLSASGKTKAGGQRLRSLTLTMETPDAPDTDAEYFTQQVDSRTNGRIRIIEANNYGSCDPDNEARLVRALRSGKAKMAYIPSRAWERASDITTFRALQAPFLVTDYTMLRRIATGEIGHSMLGSLGQIDLVGLGLVPNELRRPLGRRPLVSATAFRGARIRVVTSPTSVLALRTLGAIPMTNFDCHMVTSALRKGHLDGIESSTRSIEDNAYTAEAPYLTSNLPLFAKTQTIAIRRDVFARLGANDQRALRAAAAATVAHANPEAGEEVEVQTLCNHGLRLVRTSAADVVSLRRAVAPAFAALRHDPRTRREIDDVARLRERERVAAAALPACRPGERAATQSGTKRRSSEVEGTYSMSASAADINAAPRHQPGLVDDWGSFKLVLHAGRFGFFDYRPAGAAPHVRCRNGGGFCADGSTTGHYVIRGTRIEFFQETGAGDTPMGEQGDQPIVCRWSLYRDALTFHLIANLGPGYDAGPPLLYVKPWRRLR